MKRRGILNADLAGRLAGLGHTDRFLVTDSGFPVPAGVPVVDLRVVYGLPGFAPVLDAILAEVVVEAAVVAEELATANPRIAGEVQRHLPDATTLSHADLKREGDIRFAVRTAEDTPYANVLLTAGVGFPV
ncbi:D-ribose pyranase [Microbacterium sp. cf332]|uniref:D-ribose pyranase n=1 Tax=Microbacterium sp. cf332 TaxID=1761804 RepID=UPI000883C006|nr:D-ribose pyranase [Microbacterium sp. cf332]SDQ53016.1 D-ribose pyranase [Microbacterium sp. cf332]